MSLFKDVEKREANRERLELFKIGADKAPESIFLANCDAEIEYVNERASESLGFSREDLLDMKVFELDPSFSSDNWDEHWNKVREKGRLKIESRLVRKDGTDFPVELLINHEEFGDCEYHFTFARDISERKEREDKLRRAREEYEELIDGMNDAVFVHDLEGNFLKVNDTAVDRLGYSEEEFRSMKPQDIDAPTYSEGVKDRIEDLEENDTLVFESVHVSKEGEEIPVEISSSLVDYCGKTAVLSIARDITDRKRGREMREFLNSLLTQDVRNMVGNSLGFLELIEGEDFGDECREYLDRNIQINKKISNIVDLAEEVRKTGTDKGPTNLGEIMEKVVKECRDLTERKEVEIRFNRDEFVEKIIGGYGLVKGVSGLIKSGIWERGCGEIAISMIDGGDELVVRLDDDGEKIPEPVQDKLYEHTYTGETSTLGGGIFFMASEIIENYEGSVEVKNSEKSEGKFDVRLKKYNG